MVIKFQIKVKIAINHGYKKSARLADKTFRERNVFKLVFMFGNILGVKKVNLMFFTTHLALNVMMGPTIASCVISNPNISREHIALRFVR